MACQFITLPVPAYAIRPPFKSRAPYALPAPQGKGNLAVPRRLCPGARHPTPRSLAHNNCGVACLPSYTETRYKSSAARQNGKLPFLAHIERMFYFPAADLFGAADLLRGALLGPLRASLTAFPARNRTALLAAILIASPLCGLRPWRADRAATSKVPRPETRTASPAMSESIMAFTTAFTGCPAAAWFSSVARATFSISSDWFITPALILLLLDLDSRRRRPDCAALVKFHSLASQTARFGFKVKLARSVCYDGAQRSPRLARHLELCTSHALPRTSLVGNFIPVAVANRPGSSLALSSQQNRRLLAFSLILSPAAIRTIRTDS